MIFLSKIYDISAKLLHKGCVLAVKINKKLKTRFVCLQRIVEMGGLKKQKKIEIQSIKILITKNVYNPNP